MLSLSSTILAIYIVIVPIQIIKAVQGCYNLVYKVVCNFITTLWWQTFSHHYHHVMTTLSQPCDEE